MSDMPPQPDPSQCVLDENSQLKDANHIAFFHSPSDNNPIPLPPVDGEIGTSLFCIYKYFESHLYDTI